MTFPGGLLAGSQSAMARLLAQMQGQPQPTPAWNPNANPVQGGMQSLLSQNLSQNPVMGEGPGLMAQPPQEDPAHNHRKGIRGGILHAIGADRTPPELDALLTDEQAKRAQPGLIASVGNFLIRGRTPQQVQMERAATMLGLQDKKVDRDTTARQQAMMAQVQQMASTMPPQEAAEFVARMGTVYGLPGFADAAQAAQRTRPDAPTQVSRGAAVQTPDGRWEIPSPITPEPDTPKPVLSTGPYLGGTARFKDGVFDAWVLRPPAPETPADQRLRSTYSAQNRSIDDTLDAIETYRKQLKASGVEVKPGAAKSRLTGAYANLKLKAKEAANLGALTGPDVVILEEMFNDPTALGTVAKNLITGGGQKAALLAQLDQYENIVKSGKARLDQNYQAQTAQQAREKYVLPNPREDEP